MAALGPASRLVVHRAAPLTIDEWSYAHGWDFSFWDWIETCARCGRDRTFLVSPGLATPLLPMWTPEGELAGSRERNAQARARRGC